MWPWSFSSSSSWWWWWLLQLARMKWESWWARPPRSNGGEWQIECRQISIMGILATLQSTSKLMWQWKIPIFNTQYIFKRFFSIAMFSLPEGIQSFSQLPAAEICFLMRGFLRPVLVVGADEVMSSGSWHVVLEVVETMLSLFLDADADADGEPGWIYVCLRSRWCWRCWMMKCCHSRLFLPSGD